MDLLSLQRKNLKKNQCNTKLIVIFFLIEIGCFLKQLGNRMPEFVLYELYIRGALYLPQFLCFSLFFNKGVTMVSVSQNCLESSYEKYLEQY